MSAVKNRFKINIEPKVLKLMVQASKAYKETKNPLQKKMFQGALGIIIKQNVAGIKKLQVQNAAVSSDFASIGGDSFNLITQEDYFDRGWEMAYAITDVVPGTLYFNNYTAETSIEWKKMQEGERVDQQGFQGTNDITMCEYHAAAIGWTDKLMKTSTPMMMINKLRALMVGYWVEKADAHYQLINAAAQISGYTALQGVGEDSKTQRVVLTVNEVSSELGRVNKDKGYGDTAQIPRIMYCQS